MKKIANFIIKQRFIITPLLLLITVYTFTLADDVNINYDFSKYLPEESIATKDTNSVRESIDFPISISLMVDDIEENEIDIIKNKVESLDSVEVVIIDSEDINNYKDQHALYTVFLKSSTEDVGKEIENIENELDGYSFHLSGNYANTYHQELKVEEETPVILIVACVVIFVVLLLTTKRYLEPIAFGFVIGVAIVINLGTNIIFPEISYITKSVAAVLQLGLSMDYSIILLNNYYNELENETNNRQAMINALSNSIKPISASSLTTVIGLVALLFMSFTIGTDIGLVLSKGIVISLVCVFVLLPNIILWLEKVPFNKMHRTLNLSNLSIKSSNGKVTGSITALAFILIIAMFYVQSQNSFVFTDNTKFDDEEAIKEVFGDSNTFVIGIENNDNLYNNEKVIVDTINEKYSDQIITYLGEENSTKKRISYKDLSGITDEESSKLLFSVYALEEGVEHRITYNEYINTLESMINNGTLEVTEEMESLIKVISLNNVVRESYTSKELIETNIFADQIDNEMVELIYNMYEFDHNNELMNKFTLREYLQGLIVLSSTQEGYMTDNEKVEIETLLSQLNQLDVLMNTEATQEMFGVIAMNNLGVTLDEQTIAFIYNSYFASNSIEVSDTIKVQNTLAFMAQNGMLDEVQNTKIEALLWGNETANTRVKYTEMNNTLNTTIYCLTGDNGTKNIDETINKVTFVTMMDSLEMFSDNSIPFQYLLTYMKEMMASPLINQMLPQNTVASFDLINDQITLLIDETKMSQKDMNLLLSNDESEDVKKLTKAIYGTDFSKLDFVETYTVSVEELLEFILNNDLGLDEETLKEVEELDEDLITMKNIISSDKMSLIVFNTTLPYESVETKEFIDYVYDDVFGKVDEETYFIGYSVSDQEIKMYFEDDLMKINFITIGSVLLVLIITFQSFIIPILLVFTIEGAIWTTLSVSYFQGEDIFFFCYIVIGAIQLGATIDYAIILTTNYQKYRVDFDKREALRKALHISIPSILTSGTILTVAGFAIAFVSSQASIVSVGSFLGRGTLISMLYVVTVLPSMLFTFDGLIIKRQKKMEVRKQKLKKQFNLL